MSWFALARGRDDRGRRVEIGAVDLDDEFDDPELDEIGGYTKYLALPPDRLRGRDVFVIMTATAIVLGLTALLIHLGVTAWLGVPLSLIAVCLAMPPIMQWSAHPRAHLIRDVYLRANRCASCGYSFAEACVEHDGCRVCPECGAAWKVPIVPPQAD